MAGGEEHRTNDVCPPVSRSLQPYPLRSVFPLSPGPAALKSLSAQGLEERGRVRGPRGRARRTGYVDIRRTRSAFERRRVLQFVKRESHEPISDADRRSRGQCTASDRQLERVGNPKILNARTPPSDPGPAAAEQRRCSDAGLNVVCSVRINVPYLCTG